MNSKPQPQSSKKARTGPRVPRKITETYLHNAGLFYLEKFSASRAHFHGVMMRKVRKSCRHHTDQDPQACAEMVDRLADKFESSGLLNDETYARNMVNSLRSKGKSRRDILARLGAKGLPAALINAMLQEYEDEKSTKDFSAEMKSALVFARKKKIGPFKGIKSPSEDKSLGMMGRAGFSYETARAVLSMKLQESEEILRF